MSIRTRMSELSPQLSVVIPCYNEFPHIEKILLQWHGFLRENIENFEMIVVNDGSSDGTGRILDALRKEHDEIRVIHQLHLGHSQALRRGYEAVRGHYTLQVDGCGRYDPSDFLRMWKMREKSYLVLGARTHRLDGWTRRLFSFLLRKNVKWIFGVQLKDPNIPFRLMDSRVLKASLPAVKRSLKGVNLRLSLLFRLHHPDRVNEIPVPHRLRPWGRSHRRFWGQLGRSLGHLSELLGLRLSQLRNKLEPMRISDPLGQPAS